MKNRLIIKTQIILSCFFVFFLFSCNTSSTETENEVKSIFISQKPEKLNYTLGETLDLTGIEIRGKYKNDFEKVITNWTSNPIDGSRLTTQGLITIIISYKSFQTSFTITVQNNEATPALIPLSIFIDKKPTKLDYEYGETLDLAGLIVKVKYNNNSEEIIEDWTSSPKNGSKLTTSGTVNIKISYNSINTTFSIIVAEKPIITSNPYFWGIWVRMDSGMEYEILETYISHKDKIYNITSSDSNTLTVSGLGTFTKESDSVMVNKNIPYFRKGGANLQYSLKLVGFTSQTTGRANSTIDDNLSGIKGQGKSKKYKNFISTSESNSEGIITFEAPVPNDPQTVTITNGDDIVVIPGLSITNTGDYMGTVALVGKDDYNLKITGTINNKDNGYLYGNNISYDMDVTITNISKNKCKSSICSIESNDPNLTIKALDDTVLDAFTISTLEKGATKTIKISLSYGTITEAFKDTGINIIIENPYTGQIWTDFIPLRFFKGLIPITVAGQSTEQNNLAALNGFIIYPDGNNQFFSVPNNTSKILLVPSFGNDKRYKVVFSGATVTSSLSDSTEMYYTISPGTTKMRDIDIAIGNRDKLREYMTFGGNNHNENNAYETTESFQAYLSEGEIDYYSIIADSDEFYSPNEKKLYYVDYYSDYGLKPTGFYIMENTTLAVEQLPVLEQQGRTFDGWYINEKQINPMDSIDNYVENNKVTLTAKWTPIKYSIYYKLNGGNNNSLNPETFTIDSPTIKLESPSLFSHSFEGWYFSDSFEGNKVTEIPTGSHEDITLWAKWNGTKYNATITATAPVYSEIPNLSVPVINENIITFSAPDGYTEYAWYIDDSIKPLGTTALLSIDLQTTSIKAGYHLMNLEVKDSYGNYYSAQYEFNFKNN